MPVLLWIKQLLLKSILTYDSVKMSERTLTQEELDGLFPIRNFSDNNKKYLEDNVTTQTIEPGTTLFAINDENTDQIYVLEGKVSLATADNQERVIQGGQMEARFPLANQSPRKATAKAQTALTILKLEKSDLEKLLSNEMRPDDNGVEVSDESTESFLYNQLYFDVTHEMQSDRLQLPSIPEVANKVRHAIEKDDVSSETIAKIVQLDPAIAAQLIKVANSPLFRGREKIESLPNAITRLGLKAIRNLITSFTMKTVFVAKTKMVAERMHQLWFHSRLTAAVSAVLASRVKGFDVGKAMLAGLTHDIGAVPVLTHADMHPNLITNADEVKHTVSQLKPVIGEMIMRKWNFPDEFADIALNAEHWYRDSDGPADYIDLIQVAQLLSYQDTPMMSLYPEADAIPAFQRIQSQLRNPEFGLDVLQSAREEINEVQQILG